MGLDIIAYGKTDTNEEHDIHFRAGSYSGYNQWRAQLCMLIHDIQPSVMWDNPEVYVNKSFYHLINFSDCEGTITGKEAIKLASDFKEHQAVVDEIDDEYFKAKYGSWRKSFELASNGGAVEFH